MFANVLVNIAHDQFAWNLTSFYRSVKLQNPSAAYIGDTLGAFRASSSIWAFFSALQQDLASTVSFPGILFILVWLLRATNSQAGRTPNFYIIYWRPLFKYSIWLYWVAISTTACKATTVLAHSNQFFYVESSRISGFTLKQQLFLCQSLCRKHGLSMSIRENCGMSLCEQSLG